MKPRKCKAKSCGIAFTPQRMGQHACSPLCAVEIARAKREQAEQRKRSDEREKDRQKREELKTVPTLIAEAQDAFNLYIRLRDGGGSCFTCGDPIRRGGVGGGFDAGHIRPRSAASHLRFNEDNCHGQCKPCNAPGGILPHVMRARAIERIGLDRYLALENDNRVHKWQRDELRAIRDKYRRLARELEKQ